ncbi:NVEALA domain-containing protein [Sphingobacterium sp. UT-1RO-CII-1]|uniref:NVEALA domain-containing protein n=1 Tax=Sphingobacterium sp. UT-1RO-CII-1 TaxID=2995225 RepID=UPI00227BECFD|nr:NVEALA domain-containing protein [Sphingobacterium sp. UT-1RO-CII-1]MCY4778300.1 NVEALA domain-containing protein [Sphingobacterium sp. UT-1RO-CII-1]
MKKKILGAVAVVAIAAVATFNMNINNNDELSAISLANVEALAMNETEPEKTKGTVIPCHTYENGRIVGMGNTCGGSNSDSCYSNPCN